MSKRIATFIATMSVLVATLILSVVAEENAVVSGTSGDCKWTLDGTVLTISGNGEIEDCDLWGKNITEVIIEDGVTSIGNYTFDKCRKLINVKIPNSVTSIGYRAFADCTELTSITIPDSVKNIESWAFFGCTGLTSINIPGSVISIGDFAFNGCTGLTRAKISNGVTGICHGAFRDCTRLANITISDSVKIIEGEAFYNTQYYNCPENWDNDVLYISNHLIAAKPELSGTYTVKNSAKTIAENAFYGCTKLAEIIISNSVESVGVGAFCSCTNLKDIVIPDSVINIGDIAFSNCAALTNITIPDNIENIGYGVFSSCTGLKSVTIGNDIKAIGDYAFQNCTRLTSITMPDSIKSISNYAFDGCNIKELKIAEGSKTVTSTMVVCNTLEKVVIPNSVTSISEDAFTGCMQLKGVYITDIKKWCEFDFKYSWSNPLHYAHTLYLNGEKVTDLVIPDGITEIKDYTFANCTGLTKIAIPYSVTKLIGTAFAGCTELQLMTVDGNNPVYHSEGNCIIDTDGKQLIFGCKNSLIPSNGSVISIGDYAFSNCAKLANIAIPDSVTSIGKYAFEGCTGLTSITISDGVKFIGDYAFEDCNIKELKIAEGSKSVTSTMSVCENTLEKVVIPNSVNSISDYAFYNCAKLTSINIPSSVTSIGKYAFGNCTGLKSLTIPDSVASINYYAFKDCNIKELTIAEGSKSVTSTMVLCEDTLEKVVIPNSVTSISEDAFTGCTKLKGVYITDIKKWCEFDFKYSWSNPLWYASTLYLNGEKITDLIIPDCVTKIKDYAFTNCKGLKSLTIPDSVVSIDYYAFEFCNIKELRIAEGSKSATPTMIVRKNTLEKVVIPNSVNSISDYAFYNCAKLTSINIPSSVTSIGNYAFKDCTGLKNITISDTVKSIGKEAFCNTEYYNYSENWENGVLYIQNHLIKAKPELSGTYTVKNGTKTIAEEAFYGCTQLKLIKIPNSVTSIGEKIFNSQRPIFDVDKTSFAYKYAKRHGITIFKNSRWIGENNNPLVSFYVPDITIIENTNGTQKDGYYCYAPSDIKCIATYKDGEKEYRYAYVDNSELEKQETTHWTVGNTYRVKMIFNGMESYANVSIIKNPIKTIKIQDFTAEEGFLSGRYGDYMEWKQPHYTVTLNDGTVLTSDSDAIYDNYVVIGKRKYCLELDVDSLDVNSLKAGDSVKINCELATKKASYNLNIIASQFKELHVDDVAAQRDEFTDYYSCSPKGGYVVLKNGEKTYFKGSDFTYNGKLYSLAYDYSYKQLNPGSTYELTASLGNLKTIYKVTAIPRTEISLFDITEIEIISPPAKTEYISGEMFSLQGAVIRISYNDGSFEDIKDIEDIGSGSAYLYSKKLAKFVLIDYSAYLDCSVSSVRVSVTYRLNQITCECPVLVRKSTWSDITVSDWFTRWPKITVTENDGSSFVLNVKRIEYGDGGGGDSWYYNSTGRMALLYTDKGLFYADIYDWINNDDGKCYFNIYLLDKRLKSNTVCGGFYEIITETLERRVNEWLFQSENAEYLFSRSDEIEFNNGFYYLKRDYVYEDGSCKTLSMVFNEDLNIVSSEFLNNPDGGFANYEKGDINKDGVINILDLIALKKRIAEKNTDDIEAVADLNKDGKIDFDDITMLKKMLIGA